MKHDRYGTICVFPKMATFSIGWRYAGEGWKIPPVKTAPVKKIGETGPRKKTV